MIDLVLGGLATLATAIAFGVFIYTQVIYKRPLPSEDVEKKELIESVKGGAFSEAFKLKPLIINLNSRKTRLRFLNITAHLLPFKNGTQEQIEEHIPRINDAIIEVAGNMRPSELNSVAGKILFESRVKKKINHFLGKAKVKEIYFSRFVVQ